MSISQVFLHAVYATRLVTHYSVARADKLTYGRVDTTSTNFSDRVRTSTYKIDVQLATTENRPLIRIEGWGIGRRVRVFLDYGQLTMCSIKVSGTLVTGERSGPHTAVQHNTLVLSRNMER